MDDLMIRYLQGQATAAEEEQLRKWRQEAIENERYFREASRVWELAEVARRTPVTSGPPAARDLLARATPSPRRTSVLRGWLLPGAAAAATLLIGLALGRLWHGVQPHPAFAATELTTGPAEMVTARLEDGSIVRLAPNSRLSFNGRDALREAWLEGQAFFTVASGSHPFVVRTRAGEARVLGTRFSVGVRDDSLQLVVVEGRVALSAGGQRVEVGAGEVSHVARGSALRVQRVSDPGRFLAWMNGVMVFDSTPLREVAREIERRYAVQVELRDSALAERTVTALFTRESLDDVLSIVCHVVDAHHCSVRGSVVRIEP